jgi:hypothetical protein
MVITRSQTALLSNSAPDVIEDVTPLTPERGRELEQEAKSNMRDKRRIARKPEELYGRTKS